MKQRCSESPLSQDQTHMRLGQWDHPVQTHPGGIVRSHARRSRWPWGLRTAIEDLQAKARIEPSRRFARSGPIVDQVLVLVLVAGRLSQLLQSPARARVCRDVHVYQAAEPCSMTTNTYSIRKLAVTQ